MASHRLRPDVRRTIGTGLLSAALLTIASLACAAVFDAGQLGLALALADRSAVVGARDAPAPFPALWPYPQGRVALGNTTVWFPCGGPAAVPVRFVGNQTSAWVVRTFRNRVAQRIGQKRRTLLACRAAEMAQWASGRRRGPTVGSLVVALGDSNADPLDESYELQVVPDKTLGDSAYIISIRSRTPVGAIRALTTLSQLVHVAGDDTTNVHDALGGSRVTRDALPPRISHAPWTIRDAPAFRHRGVLVDSARHFIPVATLLRVLDGMAAAKLNVLHWHLSDSQSFPVELASVPEATRGGGETGAAVYSRADVLKVVAHARERGIAVVPEIDTPGHTSAWAGIGVRVLCDNVAAWEDCAACPPSGQLDVRDPATVSAAIRVIREVAETIGGALFHVGADEVNLRCYREAWNATDDEVHASVAAYLGQVRQSLATLDPPRRVVRWNDAPLLNIEDVRDILQVWVAQPPGNSTIDSTIENAQRRGHDVIASPHEYLYLDCGLGAWIAPRTGEGISSRLSQDAPRFTSWCDPLKSWQTVYAYSPPVGFSGAPGRVLGGEVALWGELIDASNIETVAFPRVWAAGEGLWAFPEWKDAVMSAESLSAPDPLRAAVEMLLPFPFVGGVANESRWSGWAGTSQRLAFFRRRAALQLGIAGSPVWPTWCDTSPDCVFHGPARSVSG